MDFRMINLHATGPISIKFLFACSFDTVNFIAWVLIQSLFTNFMVSMHTQEILKVEAVVAELTNLDQVQSCLLYHTQ